MGASAVRSGATEGTVEARLQARGWTLPKPTPTLYDYLPILVHDDVAHVAGQVPKVDSTTLSCTGVVGVDVTSERASEAIRLCVLHGLSWIRESVGTLDRITAILRLNVYVRAGPVPGGVISTVADSASEVFRVALGDAGRHPRSVIGVSELPRHSPVMIDFTAALSPGKVSPQPIPQRSKAY